MRHAKSDWSTGASSDFARPLNQRGRRDAPRVAAWLAENSLVPDLVVSSPSARTRETLMLMCKHEAWDHVDVEFESDLYMASSRNVQIMTERYVTDTTRTMILAHNPGLEYWLEEQFGPLDESDEEKVMPTAAVAMIDWFESKNLAGITRPRTL